MNSFGDNEAKHGFREKKTTTKQEMPATFVIDTCSWIKLQPNTIKLSQQDLDENSLHGLYLK